MTAPFFTSNDQDVIALEGLYIKERNPPAQVKGVTLNGIGVVGECVRGPVNQVVEITSQGRFREVFGARDKTADGSGGTLLGKVYQFLLNKPFGKLYVVRAAAAAAVKASFTLESVAGGGGTTRARIDAANPGTWGNTVGWKVSAATDGDATHWNLTIRYLGNDTVYKNVDTTAGNDNTSTVLGDDLANLVTVTKLSDGRPSNSAASTDGADADGFTLLGQTVAAYTSVAGTDGSIADTDFTGTGKGLELLAAYKGVSVVAIAERMSTALKDKVELLAAFAVDRDYLVGADDETVDVADAVTDAALQASDRIFYCYNHFYTRDPDTATEVLCRPESLMASILSQTAVDVHPGDFDNRKYAAGVTRLYSAALSRQDYVGPQGRRHRCAGEGRGLRVRVRRDQLAGVRQDRDHPPPVGRLHPAVAGRRPQAQRLQEEHRVAQGGQRWHDQGLPERPEEGRVHRRAVQRRHRVAEHGAGPGGRGREDPAPRQAARPHPAPGAGDRNRDERDHHRAGRLTG
jgi:hypothetical protein